MNVIELSGISKNYGATQVLEDVSFTCEAGEFFTLFGPSGAGKTTTLEIIAGLASSFTGTVKIHGKDMRDIPIQARGLAMVFENYALYPHFSVRENISFPLRSPRAKPLSAEQIETKVVTIAEQLGIADLLDRRPTQLSGGQKQRVGLARALVRPAQAYLLDEPLAHLDAKLRTIARANLKELARELGATIIYVTHDFREALGLSDRILILNEGRILQVGTPKEIYHHPQTDLVAHLVGEPTMSLLDGEIQREGDVVSFIAGGSKLQLQGTLATQASQRLDNGKVQTRLGIRAAAVTVGKQNGNAGFMKVYALIGGTRDKLVYLQFADSLLGGYAPASNKLALGDEVPVAINQDAVHLFDPTFQLT